MKTVETKISDRQDREIEVLVERGWFPTRDEVVQAAIRQFLTDDAAARLVAEKLGYEVHGSIGVVVRALRRSQRTKRQVLNLLQAIPRRSTLHIAESLLASVIDQVRTS